MTTATLSRTSTWAIDPVHSSAEFSVRHLMISTVKGRFGTVAGTAALDESDLSSAFVNVSIDASSVDTRNADRDKHLRSADFFDVATYPSLSFTSRGVRVHGDDALEVTGDLTLHGVTKAVTLKAKLEGRTRDPWGKDRLAFSATTTINRKDFGLTWNQLLEAGGVAVSDEVKIALDVALVRQD